MKSRIRHSVGMLSMTRLAGHAEENRSHAERGYVPLSGTGVLLCRTSRLVLSISEGTRGVQRSIKTFIASVLRKNCLLDKFYKPCRQYAYYDCAGCSNGKRNAGGRGLG